MDKFFSDLEKMENMVEDRSVKKKNNAHYSQPKGSLRGVSNRSRGRWNNNKKSCNYQNFESYPSSCYSTSSFSSRGNHWRQPVPHASRDFSPSRPFQRRRGKNFGNYYDPNVRGVPDVTFKDGGFSDSPVILSVSECQLVRSLVDFPNHQATLLTLLDECQYDHKQVRLLVSRYPELLEIEGEMVRLRPKVSLCSRHLDEEGCPVPQTCQDLHICLKHLAGECYDEGCIYGHRIDTNHNRPILHAFHLNKIPAELLIDLFKSVFVPSGGCAEKLEVCLSYNNESCSEEQCQKLHLCLKMLAKSCSPEGGCKLNHKVFDEQITPILKSHGLSMNESPRDILTQVVSSPLVKKEIEALKVIDPVAPTDPKKGVKEAANTDDKDSLDDKQGDNTPSNDFTNTDSNKSASEPKEKFIPQKTVWFHELKGEVPVKEICYDSVEGFCPYEEEGCKRLHCNFHFHWQVKSTASDKKCFWINLTKDQAQALEKAFCDFSIDKTPLPVLDPSTLPTSAKGLLVALNGRNKWEADFDAMQLVPVSENKSLLPLLLRRLCTARSPDNPTTPEASVFKWYFLDKNQTWVEYGNIDSTGEEKLKCDITSDDIEKFLLKEGEDAVLSFSSNSFKYHLNLKMMTQTNLKTNVSRKVRRRPQPHLKDEKPSLTATGSDLPITWEPMQPEERIRRVVLSPSSQEYQGLMTHLANNGGGGLNVLKIERVQNPFLWRAFQNKVQEMTSLYKDSSIVNVRQLFHGTNPDTVPKICQENFDWRLHGSNAGQAHGRGTYFSPFASTSHGYTRPDATGNRYMFVARVAVGTVTTGNWLMTRPPMHPQYNVPYDTSANSTNNPSILVKYDKQEYFPEYIITMT